MSTEFKVGCVQRDPTGRRTFWSAAAAVAEPLQPSAASVWHTNSIKEIQLHETCDLPASQAFSVVKEMS